MTLGSSPTALVARARTLLFVPGDRPDRFDKAVATGTDLVVLDLEDAVDPEAKAAARERVAAWLAQGQAVVRVNAANTRWHDDDLAALRGLDGLLGVMVPGAEDPARLDAVGRGLGGDVPLIALVESALGVHRAFDVAAAAPVARLAFGSIDYALDIGAAGSIESLAYARGAIVNGSRAAGLAAPVDGVTVDVRDPGRLRADLELAVALGYGGKLCIHPTQVSSTNSAFGPSSDDVAWAERILAAPAEHGAVLVDGEMVDKPVRDRAARILAAARTFSG